MGNDRTDVEQMDRYFIKEDVLGVSIKDSEVDEAAARICCCLETDSQVNQIPSDSETAMKGMEDHMP